MSVEHTERESFTEEVQENIRNANEEERIMVCVFYVKGGKIEFRRHTWNWMKGDFRKALYMLSENIDQEFEMDVIPKGLLKQADLSLLGMRDVSKNMIKEKEDNVNGEAGE